jgi:prepilin-type N-terminal cleavage/methylation domain-containing protein
MPRLVPDPARHHESGFTLVEILVAISILLVGVLGVTTLVNVSNRTTVVNNSRQGATNLMRRVLETSRSLPFRSVKEATLKSVIQSEAPDLATTAAGTWKVQRDGYVYTLDATVCLVDDRSDGYGAHVSLDPPFCADSSTTGTADDVPGDYKRVTVTSTWTAGGRTHTDRQVTIVPPGTTGNAPEVRNVQASGSSTPGQPLVITSSTPTTYRFDAVTDNDPASISWLIDGTPSQTCPPTTATCGGSGNSWFFTWDIGSPTIDNVAGSPNQGKCIAPATGSSYVLDGTDQVGALPLDSGGLAGPAGSASVTINRCAPIPPPNFNATGRDANLTGPVDVEWNDNPEGDVVGYKVFRGTTATNGVQICPAAASDPPDPSMRSCVDTSPPAYSQSSPLYYGVYAYDQGPTGVVRQGAEAYLEVNTGQNSAPKAPTNLAATAGAGTVTVSWKIPTAPLDPNTGDTIESFRVYRRAAGATGPWTYQDRIDYDSVSAYCAGSASPGASCSMSDPNPDGVAHQYMVTSVDTHVRESVYITTGAPVA